MDIKEVQKRKRFAACADDEDVFREIDALETENETLQSENETYREAESAREAAEVTALLDAAEGEGRINATTRPTFEALLKADRTNGEAALKALAKKKNAMEDIKTGVGTPSMSAWDKRQEEIANNLKQ